MWESCRTSRWSAGLLGDLLFPPPLHSGAAPHPPQSLYSALKNSLLRLLPGSESDTRAECLNCHHNNEQRNSFLLHPEFQYCRQATARRRTTRMQPVTKIVVETTPTPPRTSSGFVTDCRGDVQNASGEAVLLTDSQCDKRTENSAASGSTRARTRDPQATSRPPYPLSYGGRATFSLVVIARGAISYHLRLTLVFITGTSTAQRHIHEVLRPVALPFVYARASAVPRQENADPHMDTLLWPAAIARMASSSKFNVSKLNTIVGAFLKLNSQYSWGEFPQPLERVVVTPQNNSYCLQTREVLTATGRRWITFTNKCIVGLEHGLRQRSRRDGTERVNGSGRPSPRNFADSRVAPSVLIPRIFLRLLSASSVDGLWRQLVSPLPIMHGLPRKGERRSERVVPGRGEGEGGWKRDIHEKTHRPAASSGTIPTFENPGGGGCDPAGNRTRFALAGGEQSKPLHHRGHT
ncbi:hypothetical protein PR048_007834 [Dryococelus australis]|uniref:Uncharacterized protein n=1 Tax=Dryococelus australis TaxID=614101 RepID=A0ABQ9HVD9_9NEOP|nr:hypothetical protein PR048_007834 [Dryococelus australis]